MLIISVIVKKGLNLLEYLYSGISKELSTRRITLFLLYIPCEC